MSDTPFTIKETRLMGELKCSRDTVRALRQQFLIEGTHWAYGDDKRVYLSSEGAEIIRAKKNAGPGAPGAPSGVASAPGANAAHRTPLLLTWPTPFDGKLIAWHSPKLNTTLLIAYKPGMDPQNPLNLVNVRVRDNRNFMRGDEITAAHVGGNSYDLVGPCPRYRGEYKRKQR